MINRITMINNSLRYTLNLLWKTPLFMIQITPHHYHALYAFNCFIIRHNDGFYNYSVSTLYKRLILHKCGNHRQEPFWLIHRGQMPSTIHNNFSECSIALYPSSRSSIYIPDEALSSQVLIPPLPRNLLQPLFIRRSTVFPIKLTLHISYAYFVRSYLIQ